MIEGIEQSDAMKKAIADFMQLHNLSSQDMIGQVPVTNVNINTGSNTSATESSITADDVVPVINEPRVGDVLISLYL